MVAWPLADHDLVSVAHGYASILGAWNIVDPCTWALGGILRVWRSPLTWLKDNCRGIVVLDYEWAGNLLRHALGPILCEDDDLALAVDRILNPPKFSFPVLSAESKAGA